MKHRHVFVAGLHRSGTSPLFKCLRDHPDISGFSNTGAPEDEGQHLQNVYRTARQHGGPGRFGFDPAAHLTESSPLATRGAAERLFREWRPHWDLDKPWLLEKSPPNLVRTRFLQALFPGARFVVLLRHPAAVALATVKMAAGTPVPRLIEHWLACHERFEADRPHLEHALVVRYESFVAEPDALLRQVYDFLGVAPCRLQQDIDPHGNRHYLERWNAFLRDGCGTRDVQRLRTRLEPRVKRFGYSLLDTSALVSSPRAPGAPARPPAPAE